MAREDHKTNVETSEPVGDNQNEEIAENLDTVKQELTKHASSPSELERHSDKVMIVMAGQSGVGKSSTMKLLFSGIDCLETDEVVEYGKDVFVTSESPAVKGTLSFVDLQHNLSLISKFRDERLIPMESLEETNKDGKCIYPNLVIFTVSAGDNRMVGPDSGIQKSLRMLRESSLVDEKHNNLIVVVTHAMSLPPKVYTERTTEITANIRQAVIDIFHIVDVKIIFVENSPEDFGMEKHADSDFYELPNGTVSHLNIIEAMLAQFEMNKDVLANLISYWYFKERACTEKDEEAVILYKSGKLEETIASDIRGTVMELEDDLIPEFNFQYIGRGYCPKTENFRNVSLFTVTEKKSADILGKRYAIPACISVTNSDISKSYLLTAATKEKYQNQRLVSYGLHDHHNCLSVNVNQSGKWVKGSSRTNANVVFVYEKRLLEVDLTEPAEHVKADLIKEMDKLPIVYDQENYHIFNEFFGKWGTHFVVKEWLGGSIEIETSVNKATYTEEEGEDINRRLQFYFERSEEQMDGSTPINIDCQETVTTFDGDPTTHFPTLQNLTPTCIAEWKVSLKSNPAELKHCLKLCPYYCLIREDHKYHSLGKATEEYVSGAMITKLNQRKQVSGPERNEYRTAERTPLVTRDRRMICLPLSTQVHTRKGLESICELIPGDDVLTVVLASNRAKTCVKFTEFLTYLHYDPEYEAEFLEFSLDNGQTLTISGNHLIFSVRGNGVRAVLAEKMRIGDEVVFVNDDKKIQYVRIHAIETKELVGLYAPLTNDGTLVVDGVLVSCYANVESFCLAHISMFPLRLWHKTKKTVGLVRQPVKRPNQSSPRRGVHIYAQILLFLRKFIWFRI